MTENNSVAWPGGGGDQPAEAPNVPGLVDMMQGPPGCKSCPFMGVQILQLPVLPKSGLATPGQPVVALVRHFMPCVKERCQLWNKYGNRCGMLPAPMGD